MVQYEPTEAAQIEQGPNKPGVRRKLSSEASKEPAVGTRLTATEIHDNVLHAAEEELRRPAAALLWSAVAAGLTMGLSFLAGAYLLSLAPPDLRFPAAAVGYPLGFIFVVLARGQLFTENTLEPVIPLLNRRDRRTLMATLRLWGIVLAGNLAGALVFALMLSATPMVDAPLRAALQMLGQSAVSGDFWTVGYRAVFGGWLIALMAWLVASTRATGAQILLVWLTTAPLAAFGFRHSIAGGVEVFYLAAAATVTWHAAVAEFLVPAILGNVAGGVLLVALLNYGQVAPGRRPWTSRTR